MADKGFSKRCGVCLSADAGVINLALARGVSIPIVRRKFPKLSEYQLRRHFRNHLSGPVLDRLRVKALAGVVGKGLTLAELTDSENESILSQLVVVKGSLLGAIQAAEAGGLWPAFSSLVGRLTDVLALEARILGQVVSGNQTVINNYLSSEGFVAVRTLLAKCLCHNCSKAVAQGLLAIESKPAREVIDVEVKELGDGKAPAEGHASPALAEDGPIEPSPSPSNIEGAGQDALPSAGKVTPDDNTGSPAPVIHLESFSNAQTPDRSTCEIKLER